MHSCVTGPSRCPGKCMFSRSKGLFLVERGSVFTSVVSGCNFVRGRDFSISKKDSEAGCHVNLKCAGRSKVLVASGSECRHTGLSDFLDIRIGG